MTEYRVIIPLSVRLYMDEISDHIIAISRPEHAIRYIHEMIAEIRTLSYLADALPYSQDSFIKRIHPHGKRFNIKHGTWCIIFHIEQDYVIVDRIIPSSSVTE